MEYGLQKNVRRDEVTRKTSTGIVYIKLILLYASYWYTQYGGIVFVDEKFVCPEGFEDALEHWNAFLIY